MATGERRDPFRAFNFQLEIDNIARGAFSECSGLTAEGDAVDYREGTDLQPNVRKLVGLRKYSNITLKRGITDTMDMWQWRKLIEQGNVTSARKNGTITMYSTDGKAIARWNFINAWPSKITGPSVNAGENAAAIEELELTHEGYERVS